MVKRNSYAPYGETFAPTTIDGTGYTGHVMDQATGLTYMQQRYYDPQIGQFLSVDPVGVDPLSGDGFNRFWYADNKPYRFWDPDGREATATLQTVTVTGTSVSTASIVWRSYYTAITTWSSFGLGTSLLSSVGPVALFWPSELGAHACEMSGGPRCGAVATGFPPGVWPADEGAAEWGRRNNHGAREGKGRFHGIKQKDGGKPREAYGVDPATGDVWNPEGDVVGNLEDVKSK